MGIVAAHGQPLAFDECRTSHDLRAKGAAEFTFSATYTGTSLDFVRSPWYLGMMIIAVRNVNRKHMTRSRWAVEGVVR